MLVFVPDGYYGMLATRRSLRFIERIIESESIDIVHAHMADAAFLGWLAARKRRLPLVITHHGPDILPDCDGGFFCRSIYAILLGFAARYARCNVAVAPAVAGVLNRRLGLGRNRIEVITNGVPVPEQAAAADTGRSGRMHVVSVGRLVAMKGQDQLIAAAATLASQGADPRLFIVGDGPGRESLRQQADALGLGDRVVFTGVVDDVSVYLRQADVFVSASHEEGMPLCVLEAMAWHLPVIASDIAGHRSLIGHGETGLLYPLGDVHALALAIRRVIDEPGPARERARHARRLVEERFSIDASARAYDHLYAGILRNARRRGEIPTA